VIKKVVSRHLPGYYFDPNREGFVLRGPNLVYYPDRKQIAGDVDNVTYVNATLNVGTLSGGKATVIEVGQLAGTVVQGDKVGRDRLDELDFGPGNGANLPG